MHANREETPSITIGLDVGSTTVKAAVIDDSTNEIILTRYVRHHSRLADTTVMLLEELSAELEDTSARFAVCGSGGKADIRCYRSHIYTRSGR